MPWARLVLAAFAVALLAIGVYRMLAEAPGDPIHEAVAQGRSAPAPAFEVEVLTAGDLGAAPRRWWRVARDGRVSLAELRGTPVVINFWTARCLPCRQEGPLLEGAVGDAGHGLVMLGVGSAASARQAREFVNNLGLSFPQLFDGSRQTARRWGVDGVPETFFLTREGEIVGHVVGAATAAELRRGVAAAVSGRPAGLRTGGRREPLE
jgi:cytochrome c biogenesis protein CcmG, thiol:disulfide interchange protein DsbE